MCKTKFLAGSLLSHGLGPFLLSQSPHATFLFSRPVSAFFSAVARDLLSMTRPPRNGLPKFTASRWCYKTMDGNGPTRPLVSRPISRVMGRFILLKCCGSANLMGNMGRPEYFSIIIDHKYYYTSRKYDI